LHCRPSGETVKEWGSWKGCKLQC